MDVRVIAATSRDLKEEVRERRFRKDLFYRLNVFPISIPPLGQRTEDIPLLAQYFTEKYARRMGKQIESIPKATMQTFLKYDWPGNVRELEHVIERGVIITSGRSFAMAGRLSSAAPIDSQDEPLKDLAASEREHILLGLHETGWRIEGTSGAAAILKLNPSTLRFRIKKLGIRRPEQIARTSRSLNILRIRSILRDPGTFISRNQTFSTTIQNMFPSGCLFS